MHTVYRPKYHEMKMHIHMLKLQRKRLPVVLGGHELRYDVADVNCINSVLVDVQQTDTV